MTTVQATPSSEVVDQRTTLEAFAQANRREMHVLQGQPELLWQQLHNQLQWAGPPLADRLSAEREQRSRPGARPWIHRYSRLRESEALVRTLTGRGFGAGAVSPDGTWIVSASGDGHTLKIWDVATGAERATLTGHTHAVWACAVSPDGTWIVSGSGEHSGGTLKIWDAATGAERATLSGHTARVNACAVSPDGTWIVSASEDGTLKIWDAATGAERATLSGHTARVNACAVSPDGTWIVSAGGLAFEDCTLKIWDVATGTERATLTGHTHAVWACAVSPDGTWIVSGSDEYSGGTLKIWDVATGAERATLSRAHAIMACAVSPDGTWIISASEDGTLSISDAATGAERATLSGHTGQVLGCAVSPDGTWIVSASTDKTLKIWDAATGAERAVLVLPGSVMAVAFHPSAPLVACGDFGGGVHLAHLVGIDLGPLVVTAAAGGAELTVRCPACGEAFPVERDRLGTETTCPRPACGTRLRINPFVLRPLPRRRRGWFGRNR